MFVRYFLFCLLLVFASSLLLAGEDDGDGSVHDQQLNERDWIVLVDYLRTKRYKDMMERYSNLTISGDVHTEWRHMNEKLNSRRLRGGGAEDDKGIPISRNDFDIELKLRLDYVKERAWAVAQLEFDNSAGVRGGRRDCKKDPEGWHGSGFCGDICLKMAYIGYNVFHNDCTRFDVELGRRPLYKVFDSNIEFLSQFDGILLKYTNHWERYGDWNIKLGGFVVDEKVNHFAWVTELAILNIANAGFDFKYSFIDWNKRGRNRCGKRDPKGFDFRVSQWLLYYHLRPEILRTPAYVRGAVLYNHEARKRDATDNKIEGLGWYVGLTVGEVLRKGDWAFNVQYQYVEAQAVPDGDSSGIGLGNVLGETFTADGRGNTNFKGWRLEGLYLLTDNIALDAIVEWSHQLDRSIGGKHSYSKFELEAIYAF